MKTLVLLTLTVGALAGCQQDNRNIDKKLDTVLARLDRLESKIGAGGAAGQQRAPRPEPDRSKTYAVPVEGDPADGPADAKVTLVKAYDYACPFCERVRPSMDELLKRYGSDLRIVYKQLVVHPRNAMAGALAFCAAGKQGKHREMDAMIWDKGFKVKQMDNSDVPAGGQAEQAPGQQQPPPAQGGATQKCWDTPAGCTNVVGYASELQLDGERFKADMRGDCMKLVQKDMGDMQRLGVSATPAFFVNGRYLSGAMPTEQFATLIDEELKKANERIAAGTPAAQYYQQWVLDKGLKSLSGN